MDARLRWIVRRLRCFRSGDCDIHCDGRLRKHGHHGRFGDGGGHDRTHVQRGPAWRPDCGMRCHSCSSNLDCKRRVWFSNCDLRSNLSGWFVHRRLRLDAHLDSDGRMWEHDRSHPDGHGCGYHSSDSSSSKHYGATRCERECVNFDRSNRQRICRQLWNAFFQFGRHLVRLQ